MDNAWTKAAHGVWAMLFTKDSFVPKNRKSKPIPEPETKHASKPASKGKHVQLFEMRCKVAKGFYSTAHDAPDGE